MATEFKNKMRDLMKQAWMLVKVYGFSMAEAMKQAWLVLKLKSALKNGVVKFFYQKLNGEIRTAWGTLKDGLIPETKGTERKKMKASSHTTITRKRVIGRLKWQI